MNRLVRFVFALGFTAMSAVGLSCDVNSYCLNCEKGDGGGSGGGDGGDGDADNGDAVDAPPDSNCINTGPEVCDNKDNDCDNLTDEGQLPQVGDPCDQLMGECAGGVKQCTNGSLTCTKPPMAETCDNKDNDCDGTIDDGDPGGGAKCGTDMGECIAGTRSCQNGQIVCIGAVGGTMPPFGTAETCDAKDNDCDGSIDENMSNLGPCPTGTDTGECNRGTQACIGGGVVCQGAVGPSVELCDNLDQDCDGNNTNGYDLDNDPTNCGSCGMKCMLNNAVEGCSMGSCTVLACENGFHNNNNMPGDGCEFGPCTIQGNEVCNGADDDCDGATDSADSSMTTPPVSTMCRTQNECSTAFVMCDGANGFRCVYPDPDVQQMNGVVQQETLCDGKDNDCDGAVDEGQPGLGNACTRGQGECQTSGMLVCDSSNLNGPAVCNAATPGAGTTETCDGRDNDCDGIIDNGASTGNLAGQDWITVPGTSPAVQMMKWEAVRPDATPMSAGTQTTHACSKSNAIPWTNVTYPQAVAACSSIGARLCSEAEWQRMCVPPVTYPVTGPATTGVNDFVFIEAEDALANTTIPAGTPARAWTQVAPLNFNGVTAMQVPDNGFEVTSSANALSQSSRLDFQLSLTSGQQYTIWARMRSPSPLRDATRPTQTLAPVSAATTQVGDLVVVSTWTVGNGVPSHTLQSGFTQIASRSIDDGNFDGRLSIAYRVATSAGAVAYQAYTASSGTSYSGITVVRAGLYNLNFLQQATAAETDGGFLANPPAVPGALGEDSIVLTYAAYQYTSALEVEVTAPSSFKEVSEMSGAQNAELATANALFATGTTPNPGSFGDDRVPTGNVTATIAIGSIRSRSAWVGLNPGTSAGNANSTPITTTADEEWQWVKTPTFTASGTTHTFSIYTREDGVYIDTIAVARQANESPTFDNSWSYQTNPRTPQPTTCNADDLDTNTSVGGDQDDVLATGFSATCHVDKGANDAFDMSGNVKEWTLARSPGFNPLRGGSSNNEVLGTTCKIDFSSGDNTFFFPNVGFRCCR